MNLKIKYYEIVLYVYLIGLISFVFLRCQEITAQEVATLATVLTIPFISRFTKSKGNYNKIVLVIVGYTAFEAVRSFMRYGQGANIVFYLSCELLSLFLYFYFNSLKERQKIRIFNILVKFFKIALVILLFVALAYNIFGIMILDPINYSRLRGGNVRLYNGSSLLQIGLILLWGSILYKKNAKIKINRTDYVFVVIALLYFIFVCQSRMVMVVMIATLSCMYVYSYRNASKKTIVIPMMLIAVILLSFLPPVQSFIDNSFGGILAGTDNATLPRIQAVTHFIDVTSDDKLLGLGFMSYSHQSNGVYDIAYLSRGPWGVFYTNDVGIVGYYATFGILGLLIYLCIAIKMLKQGLRERYDNPHKLGIALLFILESITITFFDQERQAYLMLILLCMDLCMFIPGKVGVVENRYVENRNSNS